ncbi:hypothetical protein CHUAL_006167 [Chamberlinius hualienensis]
MSSKKGKKSASKKKDTKRKEDGEKLSELDKEIFLNQIRDLNEKLNRVKTKNQELENSCKIYKKEIEDATEDKKEIVAYLRKTLDQRADEIAELQERLNGLQKAKDDEKTTFEELIVELKTKYQEMKDQLTSENIVLSGKLTSLEEFKAQKEETFAKLETLTKQLKQQEQDHHQTLRNTEKHNIIEKDQLKKEMNQNLQKMSEEFRKISNQQMPDTTRRAIQENAILAQQIQNIRNKLESAIEDNRKMTEIINKQKLKISALEGTEKEWIARNQSLIKMNQKMNTKISKFDVLQKEFESTKQNFELLEKRSVQLQEEVHLWKSESLQNSNNLQTTTTNLTTLKLELENSKTTNVQLKQLLSRLTLSLKSRLNIDQVVDSPSLQPPKQTENDEILRDVLDVLNSKYDMSENSINIIENDQGASAISRYLCGDIGFVPRPKQNIHREAKTSFVDKNIQTEGFFYMSDKTTNNAAKRAVKSAAYRLLRQADCSPTLLSASLR